MFLYSTNINKYWYCTDFCKYHIFISCFPVGYREIAVKYFSILTLVEPVKISIFIFLLSRLIARASQPDGNMTLFTLLFSPRISDHQLQKSRHSKLKITILAPLAEGQQAIVIPLCIPPSVFPCVRPLTLSLKNFTSETVDWIFTKFHRNVP